jgi:type III pantothenate kinase
MLCIEAIYNREEGILLFVLDISNSTIKAGIFEQEKLIANWQFATERHKIADDYAMLILNLFKASNISLDKISGVCFSSVVPPLRSVFAKISRRYLKTEPLIVSPDLKTDVAFNIDNLRELGGDRIVNALATYRLYGGPAISIAFGTATVFDCISGKGEYLGGAIAPGMIGALESLTQSAAQLYQIEIVRPAKAIGKNTIHMMQSGLVLGYVALVEGTVDRLKREMVTSESSKNVNVIATGGLAEIIAPETKAIQVVDQHLLLKGLRLIYAMNK